jgi:ERAP1-like C-terminal domain
LERFARHLLHSTVEKIGWEERPIESSQQQLLRAIVLDAAAYFGESATVEEVHRRFAALRKNLDSVPANLQGVIFTSAV